MPVLSDEDVGLGSSYLSDEDVGLGGPEELLGEPGGERVTESELQEWTPQPERPGFFKSFAHGFKAPLESMRGGAGLLGAASVGGQGQDQYLKDLLQSEFEKSQDVAPPTKLGQAGELIGGLGGSLLQYAATSVATGGTPVGPMLSFGAGGAHNSFIKSGLRAMAEGKSVDDALVIAKGAAGVGAVTEAALGAIPGSGGVVRQAVTGGGTMGGGQMVGNLAERGLGLETPVMEGVGQAALTGAVVPVVGSAVARAAAAGGRRFTPPERGGIPEPVDIASSKKATFGEETTQTDPITLAGDQVKSIQSEFGVSKERAIEMLVEANRESANEQINRSIKKAEGQNDVIQEPGREAKPASEAAQIRAAEPQGEVQGRGEELPAVQPKEGNAPQDPRVLLDKSKWTKATDTENLKAATPEQRVAAAQKPLDVDSFLATDKEGFRSVDPERLRTAVEGGHITSGDTAVDALLLHLIKPSDNHPLTSIRMLDFTPGEAQLLTGTSAPFHGRFSKKAGQSAAMVEMTMKMQKGEPVSQAQFVETLAHELGHNNITSKFDDATPEMRKDIDDVFAFAKERGKGTEWENHNSLTSAHELFAEIADPKVYEWLAGLDFSERIRKVDIGIAQVPAITPPNIRNSALGRILEIAKRLLKLPDFITDAFGNKVETISALDQIISLSSRLEKIKRSGKEAGANLSEAKTTRDFKSAIKESDSVSNEELLKSRGGATGAMWDLGAKARTPEDVAALKTMAEEATAKVTALAQEGKIEEAMAIAGRQPAEAYEFATGVKLDGTPKWETFEKRRPGYVPPVPDAKYLEAKGGAAKVESVAGPVANTAGLIGAAASPQVMEPQQLTSLQRRTGATETTPETGIGGQMLAGIPNPVAVYRGIQKAVKDYGPSVKAAGKAVSDATKAIYRENLNIRKMNDLDRSVLHWSGKMQRSFGEADSAQKDVQTALLEAAEKQMGGSVFTRLAEDMATGGRKPNQKQMVEVADDALSNWLEAGGGRKSVNDVQNKLVFWRNQATDPKLKAGYEAALHLSPQEQALALDGRAVYDQLWDRAERWGLVDKDPTKPSSFRDDYVTHLWNLGKGTFAGGARRLKDQFKFAKARTFENYFEGEQAGFKPKTKRLSQLLPVYIHEMNSVIAAKQLVKQMWGGKAKDGSPLLATRGGATPVDGAKGEAVLVRPDAPSPDSRKKGLDISKYRTLPDQPALHDWIFIGKDTAGKPVYEKADLVLHPEAYDKLKAILGKSKIKEWYESEGTGPLARTMKIPKAIAKGLDIAQSETKRTMLGAISPFHQVQEGTHALGHWVNPFFNVPKPNMENPAHLDMAKNGLMILPDRASERNFTEGLRPSGLVSKIPGIGPLADHYSHYLFHEYIPGLKIKTYERLQRENMKTYAKELASGEVKPEDVKLLTSTQVNAAYGHQNYADFGRDPTIQHILQLGLLAPDFLEARTRFTLQGMKGVGSKVGREQILALATLAVGQAALAYTMAKVTDGEWEGGHPFEFRKNNRRYTLRSVPEDIARLLTDSRQFIYNRLNPITAKLPTELYFKRDQFGRKITAGEALKRGVLTPVPLTGRGFLDIDKSPLQDWEELAGAVGLKIMRYSPQNEVHKMFRTWMKDNEDPRLVKQAEQAELQTFAQSEYSDLRQALEKADSKAARKAYEGLLETKTPLVIHRAMKPESMDPDTGVMRDRMLPKKLEKRFLESLTDEEREVYEEAKRARRQLYGRFQKMLAE